MPVQSWPSAWVRCSAECGRRGGAGRGGNDVKAKLTGYQEVPALSTSGNGTFRASIARNGSEIRYRLTYARLEAKPLQAHIHLGQRGVNAGRDRVPVRQHRRRPGRHAALPRPTGDGHGNAAPGQRGRPRGPGHRPG